MVYKTIFRYKNGVLRPMNVIDELNEKNYVQYSNEQEFLNDNDNINLYEQCLKATNNEDEANNMKNAVSEYTDENYRNSYILINGRLNRGEELAEDTKRNVDLIQKAIEGNKIKKRIVVYRAIDLENYKNIKEGSIISNKGFTSTSLTEYTAKKFENNKYRPAMLKILVPNETNAIYIGKDTFSGANEKEMLFGLDTKIKILKIEGNKLIGVIQ